ncbi:MAG: glutamate-cysteine ligase family protein [Longimicrobiales bacterium]
MTDEGARIGSTAPATPRFGLFDAYGVEVELMIVDAHGFDVKPVCDELLEGVAGESVSDVELGDVTWSNELTLHVLELKTTSPAPSLSGLAKSFHQSLAHAGPTLARLGARLMPGAMHPWMDPHAETRLWPHENNEVYGTFDRIFGCSGHGWANLQSTHVNLPFQGDEEFGRLHAAIRIVLPLIPALAASSPFQDGGVGPALDGRLVAYRQNSAKVPSVAGLVVPEPVATREQYEREILGRLWADLAPHDPEGILRDEWANARGAIARFGRGTIEIRVIDAQECPTADLAVVAAIVSLVRALTEGRLAERERSLDPSTEALARVLDRAVHDGERAVTDDRALLSTLGVRKDALPLGELWARLLDAFPPDDPQREWTAHLQTILAHGPLARRMLATAGAEPSRAALQRVARGLCDCVAHDRTFTSKTL